ncbi:MAG: hypothetical protein IH944_11200 [Armatimonadetes bacterium]|nr:hypothetical protein [Armatimonadota bacterium]
MSKAPGNAIALGSVVLVLAVIGYLAFNTRSQLDYPDIEPKYEGMPKPEHQPIYDSMNEFAFRLVEAADLGAEGGNDIIAPTSLYQNLAVLLNGAEGKTFETLAEVIGSAGIDRIRLNEAQNALLNRLRAMEGRPVRIANGTFFIWPIFMTNSFVDEIEGYYNADVVRLGSAGLGAVREINVWASDRTDGVFTKVVDALSKQTVVVVINATTVNAEWETAFNPEKTSKQTFHATGGDVAVATLQSDGGFSVAKGDGYLAARLPYKGGELEMTVVLPDEGVSASNWLQTVSAESWDSMQSRFVDRVTTLRIPRFSFKAHVDLEQAITRLGGGQLFEPKNDLRNIATELRGVEIGGIDQFSFLAVHEGAQSGSGKATNDAEDSEDLLAFDRPFAFFVSDTQTGVILLVGVVNNPAAST